MYNIIFFGPPGAGKGTQAKIIAKNLKLPHLSTGEILRNKIEEKDNLAITLKEIMASGKLVSDEILNEIVANKIKKECTSGFILDGYPRTIEQSKFLDNFLEKDKIKINFIFNINLEFKVLEKRILKRSEEEKREDDNLEVIKTRYSKYLDTTKKVSDYYKYKNPNIFNELDGNHEISEITSKIQKILEILWFSMEN